MLRLAVLVLLVVAGVVAYPWAGVVVLGVWLAVGVAHWGLRRRLARERAEYRAAVRPVSLERRVFLRQARDELRAIERGTGLPDQ